MKKEENLWVISLGGSRIAPSKGKIDHKFIREFKQIIQTHQDKKFVVVTGGGSTARKYISALQDLGKSTKKQSLAGIAITRFHASFLTKIFGGIANDEVPRNTRKVKNLLKGNQIVFCGALRYKDKNTSDGTAADLAAKLKAPFINITNVRGIYTDNPLTNKHAKFIKKATWKKFNEMALKIKYKAGQHFVLDQSASKIILKHKIPTYIVGSLSDIKNIIEGKAYMGSLVSG